MRTKRQISHAEEFQSNQRYFSLEDGEHAFPFFKDEMHILTSFLQYGEGSKERNLTMEEPDKHSLSQGIKDIVDSCKSCW